MRGRSNRLDCKFRKYSRDLILNFRILMDDGITNPRRRYFYVKSADGRVWVSGIDENDVLVRFDRFLNLRVWL